jgi:hypothetical protein
VNSRDGHLRDPFHIQVMQMTSSLMTIHSLSGRGQLQISGQKEILFLAVNPTNATPILATVRVD